MDSIHHPVGETRKRSAVAGRAMGFAWLLVLFAGVGIAADPAGRQEPSVPDVLDFSIADQGADGRVTLEAIVKPTVEGAAELEIVDPGGAKLASGKTKKALSLRRGEAKIREAVAVNASDGRPRTVRAILRMLDDEGKPWLVVTKEVTLNEPQSEPQAPSRRVPIVQILPDGTRIVEYITSAEAVARGLSAEGQPMKPPREE